MRSADTATDFTLALATGQRLQKAMRAVNVNPGALTYPTLQAAFTAINSGLHTGAVTVDIVGDTTELAPAVLNASGAGSASYTSVTVRPSDGGRTISGAIAAGEPT